MSKKNNEQASHNLRRAQARNWAWCRIQNALGQLRAVSSDQEDVLLDLEKQELRGVITKLEAFVSGVDNATNWETKKRMTEAAAERRRQAEEY